MADDRWLSWQAEQAGTRRRPAAGHWSTIALLIVVALIAINAIGLTTDRDARPVRYTGPPPCARSWPPTCDQEVPNGR